MPLSLVFAIPDHPWVDTADGAAVRIAMTVGAVDSGSGQLRIVESETDGEREEVAVTLRHRNGLIHADLSIGANVAGAKPLQSNVGISCPGLKLHGAGFIVTRDEAAQLGLGTVPGLELYVRPYRNGRDLTDTPRDVLVIDLYGLSAEEVRDRFPSVFQHVLAHVKPDRDAKAHTKDGAAYARKWWLHGKTRQELRKSLEGLTRYIVTPETAKHRTFQFLESTIAPDNMLVCIALDDAQVLGVLSSAVHVTWALGAGGRLGVGNDPRYNKTRCFDPFPFPAASDGQQSRVRDLAEQLDAHRKRQQAAHPDLTLTGMYNVLDKLRSGKALSAKERTIHEHGLVSVLRQLHDELDAAVLDAYGWSDLLPVLRIAHGLEPSKLGSTEASSRRAELAPLTRDDAKPALSRRAELAPLTRDDAKRAFDESILERLVALNAERAAEEARGLVRWLRPEFQHPTEPAKPVQDELDATEPAAATTKLPVLAPAKKLPWPKDALDQVRAVAEILAASPTPLTAEDITDRFTAKGPWKKRMPQLLETLVALGRAQEQNGSFSAAG